MSYDLALFGRSGVDLAAVRRRLSEHRYWTTTHDKNLYYENGATGTFFIVVVDDDAKGGAGSAPLTLRLPLGRPSYFIREIEPEIARLVEEFELFAHDPQRNMSGAYDGAELRRNWLRANPDGDEGIPVRKGGQVLLSTEQLTAAWEWNIRAADLQFRAGEDTFVPIITGAVVDGTASTVALWPDGHPTLFPRVDAVLILRETLAPRDLLLTGRRRVDLQFVPWADVFARIGPYTTPRTDGGVNYLPRTHPDEVTKWLRKLPRGRTPSDKITVPLWDVQDLDPATPFS